jgi:di/tricarboxylate transporter
VSQPTRAEFQRLLASGALFERYAQMEQEIATIAQETRDRATDCRSRQCNVIAYRAIAIELVIAFVGFVITVVTLDGQADWGFIIMFWALGAMFGRSRRCI